MTMNETRYIKVSAFPEVLFNLYKCFHRFRMLKLPQKGKIYKEASNYKYTIPYKLVKYMEYIVEGGRPKGSKSTFYINPPKWQKFQQEVLSGLYKAFPRISADSRRKRKSIYCSRFSKPLIGGFWGQNRPNPETSYKSLSIWKKSLYPFHSKATLKRQINKRKNREKTSLNPHFEEPTFRKKPLFLNQMKLTFYPMYVLNSLRNLVKLYIEPVQTFTQIRKFYILHNLKTLFFGGFFRRTSKKRDFTRITPPNKLSPILVGIEKFKKNLTVMENPLITNGLEGIKC